MSQTNWEADKMLDVYIYDYLIKRNLQATAKAFQAEGKVSPGPVAIDAPGGFLFEWWSVFWDIFIARTDPKHSDVAASYIETQLIKGRGQQEQLQQPLQQQHQQQQQQQQQQQLQMRQLLLQRHAQQQQQQQQQQQHRDGSNLLNGSANALINSDPLARHSPGAANMMAAKMYEERLKLPLRESLDDASMKGFNENVGQMVDANHATLIKSAATSGQPAGQLLHGAARAMPGSMPQVQGRSQQLPRSMVDIKNEIDPIMTPTPRGPDGSLVGVTGPNQGGNNLTLKGWPLTAIDQLRSGILQQKPYMQSSQPLHQLQMLTPQQHLLLQAQQTLNSSSAGDADSQRLRMFLNNRSMIHGKDSQPNPIGDVIPNVGSLMQSTSAALPRGDTDLLIKQQQGGIQQHQLQQLGLSSQQSQNSSQSLLQQDKMGAGSATMVGSTSNSFRGNDQASKSHNGRKRKQPGLSSGPANSSGTANTAGPSPSSAPSTPSTHTPGDVISMPSVQHNGSSSKPLMMFGSDGTGSLTSPPDQLVDVMKWVDKGELLVEDGGSLEENIESFLSHDDNDHRDTVGRCTDVSKGFSFTEVGQTRASTNKVVCCHFSFDGKLLATGGHDKKVVLWSTDMLKQKSTLEEHSSLITDVRFSPSMPLLATSSHDKTVRVWEADNPGYSLRTFTGHSDSAMSLDFHPNKEDLICSCDGINEIRYWSIKNGSCTGVFKGRATKMRFQPRLGRYLAAASENNVSVLDVETQACRLSLQGHQKHVHSLCWNTSGDRLASVSEDSVRVWSLASGSEGKCIHELSFNGNKFHSCVFHPTYPNLLVIGCYQFLELWNMAENKTMTLSAHEGLIASLAVSNVTGLVASASHDKYVKIWK